ncbi:DUF4097 family beta strand repeat-containing protein [Kitasatospora sp. NPDC094028]
MSARTPQAAGAAEGGAPARSGRAWRITGALIVVFVLVMGGGQTLALVAKQERTEQTTYPNAIHKLELSTGSASVRIEAGAEGAVVLRKNIDWTVSEPHVRADVVGDTMTLAVECHRSAPFFNCGASVQLEVPPGTAVSGSVTSGAVEVSGLTGEVRLDGASGAISLRRVSGPVHAHTVSGMVEGHDLAGSRVDVASVSGAVDLSFAAAPQDVKVSTTSGAVSMYLPKGSHYRVNGRTGSGSSSIDAALGDPTSPNSLEADVDSGSLDIGYRSDVPKAPAAPTHADPG